MRWGCFLLYRDKKLVRVEKGAKCRTILDEDLLMAARAVKLMRFTFQ